MIRIASKCFDLFHCLSIRQSHYRRVDKNEIDHWLKGFVADLMVGGERVPLDRVIATRLKGFVSLRDRGLTWPAIAALITRAGGRRSDGKPISADQLRAVVARLLLRQSSAKAAPPPPLRRQQRAQPSAIKGASPGAQQNGSPPSIFDTWTEKDVSSDEIVAALTRIRK